MKATFLRAVLVTLITLSASAALAQDPPLILPAPPLNAPEPAPFNSLELQLGAGVSVATIHTDGAAQTGFLPSIAAAFHRGGLVVCASTPIPARPRQPPRPPTSAPAGTSARSSGPRSRSPSGCAST